MGRLTPTATSDRLLLQARYNRKQKNQMKNVKRFLAGVLVAVSVFAGGFIAAAPAQAVTGATVYVYAGDSYVRMTNTSGVVRNKAVGTSMTNVFRFCPPSISYRLRITKPGGQRLTLAYGACYAANTSGDWLAGSWRN